MANPKLFISYSWSSPQHEQIVIDLAKELRENNGVDVILDKWRLKEGHDAVAFMEKMVTDPTIKKVAIIGNFPFVDAMRNEVNKLWVFEKNPQEGDNTELEMPEILPQCDIIGITGTTIINKTLEKVLSYCRSDSKKILLGPSTPMNPLLFDWGIDMISGVLFTDPHRAFRHLSQGGTFQKIVGTKRLSMGKNTI